MAKWEELPSQGKHQLLPLGDSENEHPQARSVGLSPGSQGRSHGAEAGALPISPHLSWLSHLLGTGCAGALPHCTHPGTAQPSPACLPFNLTKQQPAQVQPLHPGIWSPAEGSALSPPLPEQRWCLLPQAEAGLGCSACKKTTSELMFAAASRNPQGCRLLHEG